MCARVSALILWHNGGKWGSKLPSPHIITLLAQGEGQGGGYSLPLVITGFSKILTLRYLVTSSGCADTQQSSTNLCTKKDFPNTVNLINFSFITNIVGVTSHSHNFLAKILNPHAFLSRSRLFSALLRIRITLMRILGSIFSFDCKYGSDFYTLMQIRIKVMRIYDRSSAECRPSESWLQCGSGSSFSFFFSFSCSLQLIKLLQIAVSIRFM